MATFVYIIGNVEQGFFKLGITEDPLAHLVRIQGGSPHKLSLISKVCLKDRNSAVLVEALGHKLLGQYEGANGWYLNIPGELVSQFMRDDYLLFLASGAGVQLAKKSDRASMSSTAALHRLSRKAVQAGLTFDDILSRVEESYEEGVVIDSLF